MKKNPYIVLLYIIPLLNAVIASSCGGNKQGNGELEIGKTYKYDSSAYYSYGGGGISYPLVPYKEIIKINTDERGLISFTFKEGKDTVGLDYVTVKGFNHWLKGEMDSVYNDIKGDSKKVLSVQTGGGYFTVISRKAKPFLFADNIDSLQNNWGYNIKNDFMWSTDSTKLATITATTEKGSHLVIIPYKPFGIYCNDSTYSTFIKIK